MIEIASGNEAMMAAMALVNAVPLFSETPEMMIIMMFVLKKLNKKITTKML
jgi:hypothetical protein